MGPATGQEVPSTLLSREEKTQIAAAMHDRSQDHAVILVVDEMCPTCEQVLDDLDRTRVRDDAPLVIVARRSTEPHAARLARLGDIAIVDARRLDKSELRWTPFVIVLDSELRVVYKALASTVERAVIRWRASDGEAGPEAIVLQTVAGKET